MAVTMVNLSLCNGKVPIQNAGNVDVIVLVDFPTKEVFSKMYQKYHRQPAIDRHYEIVKMRAAGNSLSECGRAFDLTKERIRQIEAKFLRKMREYRSSLTTDSL
jgi:hypothetical protein